MCFWINLLASSNYISLFYIESRRMSSCQYYYQGYALLCVGFPSSDVEVETQDEDEVIVHHRNWEEDSENGSYVGLIFVALAGLLASVWTVFCSRTHCRLFLPFFKQNIWYVYLVSCKVELSNSNNAIAYCLVFYYYFEGGFVSVSRRRGTS